MFWDISVRINNQDLSSTKSYSTKLYSNSTKQYSGEIWIYLFFIYSSLTVNEITVYNKNSYAYIHANDVNFKTLKKWKMLIKHK